MDPLFPDIPIDIETKQKTLPYSVLAIVYDQMMQHVEYKRWAKYIRKLIKGNGDFSPKILDIGCGTGQFIKEITALNIPADGSDFSPEMLKIARKRNPLSGFYLDSMPHLIHIPFSKYNVFTCLYDSINYLQSYYTLTNLFNRVYDLLPEEGLFIFDAVSQSFCQRYFNNLIENEIFDDEYAYSRRSYYDSKARLQTNLLIIHTPKGIFEEIHLQKIFSFEKIKRVIKEKTPFQLLAIYDDFSFFDAEEDSNRAHFILKRTRTND
jgi:SAM-dependent methyltransferase